MLSTNKTMRQAVMTGPRTIEIKEVDVPTIEMTKFW